MGNRRENRKKNKNNKSNNYNNNINDIINIGRRNEYNKDPEINHFFTGINSDEVTPLCNGNIDYDIYGWDTRYKNKCKKCLKILNDLKNNKTGL
jgi:hypothetical protein